MTQEDSLQNRHATSFRELYVYQKSMELARAIFKTSLNFPNEEKYSLTDQIRRSSRSISANIAEAWGKREYPAHFISKLSDSLAETHETQVWLDHSLSCNYITQDQYDSLEDLADHTGALIRKTSTKAHQFCGKMDRPESLNH